MSELCPACGLEPWFANTPAHYDPAKHCLGRKPGQGKVDCEARELVRLRAELARLNGAGNHTVEHGGAEPVHLHFSLSYCSYLVLHRSLMQSMPLAWQRRFVVLIDELEAATNHLEDKPESFMVKARGSEKGRFTDDPYAAYRHVRYDLNTEGSERG